MTTSSAPTRHTSMRVALAAPATVTRRLGTYKRVFDRRAMSTRAIDGAVTSNAGDFARQDGSTDWEGMWSRGITKGAAFDCSRTEPAFQNALDAKEIAIWSGRALVPGCGRWYALASLARAGFGDVVGLEISETAKEACEEQLKAESIPETARVEVAVADFFAYDPKEAFDAAYDCTFLCAIDPRRREEWARKHASLIKPGGTLVCLVFPVGDFEGGPPYALSPEIVRELLAPAGFEEIELRETPAEMYARGRLEYLFTWRRHS